MTRRAACYLGLGLLAGLALAADAPDARRAAARAEPAVAAVLVSRTKDQPWQSLADPKQLPDAFGSGVVIDHRLVLTCYHVVRDAKAILVRLPPLTDSRGREGQPRIGPARIYAADNRTDLAVLRIESEAFDTPPIEIGPGEELRKGAAVVIVTNPFQVGFRETGGCVTTGIVSNLRRRLAENADPAKPLPYYGTLVQTDARIPPGGSGGALMDLEGRLVGIVTALASLAGTEAQGGYAVPTDGGLRRVIDVLRRGEEVEYGFLGVTWEPAMDMPYRRSNDAGVIVKEVTPNSPAARAGLSSQDVIVRVNGEPVHDFADMYHHINFGLAGRDSTVLVKRRTAREPITLTARLAKAYVADFGEASNRPAAVHGLRVDYTSVVQRTGEWGLRHVPMADGVVVREVAKDSPAEAAKLAEYGDIITEVNGVRVTSPAEFYREAEKAASDNRPVRLTLVNPARTVTLP